MGPNPRMTGANILHDHATTLFSHWAPVPDVRLLRGGMAFGSISRTASPAGTTELWQPASRAHAIALIPEPLTRVEHGNNGRRGRYAMPANALHLTPAGTESWTVLTAAAVRGAIHVHFEPDRFAALADSVGAPNFSFPLDIGWQDERLAQLLGIVGDALHGGGDNGLALDAAGLLIVRTLASRDRPLRELSRGGLAPWQVRRVTDRLRATLTQPPSLAELAMEVGLSTFHFCRAFKVSTGTPPHRYLQTVRLVEAERLLSTTSLPIVDIALQIGFETPSAFSRFFQGHRGMSPRAWRARHRS